jgi:hypothetical protein
MKKTLFLLLSLGLLAGCNNKGSENQADKKTVSDTLISLNTDQVLSDPSLYAEKQVIVSGMVSHVCKHGGQKMFLVSSDGQKYLRVNTTPGIAEFPVDLEGSNVEVKGKVVKFEELAAEAETSAENEEAIADTTSKEHAYHKDNFYVIAAGSYTVKQ